MVGFRLDVRKKIDLLAAMLDFFCGDARMSMEGDLLHCNKQAIPGTSFEPTPILRRNTGQPPQDFVIFPVEPDTKNDIIRLILPQVGLGHNVLHVQVEKSGELVFGAYDSFHPDCVWVCDQVTPVWLDSLLEVRVIRQYEAVDQ